MSLSEVFLLEPASGVSTSWSATSQHCILATPPAFISENSCLMKAVCALVFTVLTSNFNQNTKAVEWPLLSAQSKWPLDRLSTGRVAGWSLGGTLAHCVVTQILSDFTA